MISIDLRPFPFRFHPLCAVLPLSLALAGACASGASSGDPPSTFSPDDGETGDELDATSDTESEEETGESESETGEPAPLPVPGYAGCGDGKLEVHEQCDDGNAIDDDGCDMDCEPSRIVQVSAGSQHSCARSRRGQIWCWGSGADGALGYGSDESIGDDDTPADWGPVPLGARAIDVSAGSAHSCAVLEDFSVRCWGSNANGRAGHGSWTTFGDDEAASDAPAMVFGAPVVDVEAGLRNTCVRFDDGRLQCWGAMTGALGQASFEDIGDDEPATVLPPIEPGGAAEALAVGHHACARISTDMGAQVRCWGPGAVGQLGYANTEAIGDDESLAEAPTVFLGVGTQVSEVAAGWHHSCVRIGSALRCWGDGGQAPLGHGVAERIGDDEHPTQILPVALRTGERAMAIGVGQKHSCLLLEDGRVRCWGYGERGELGPWAPISSGNQAPASEMPAEYAGGPGSAAVQLSVGAHHACVLTEDDAVRCWGANDRGQLGYAHVEDLGDAIGEFGDLGDVEFF